MSQGIVLFAHNNTEIDYGSVAIANATMIKHHMGVNNITLITDEGTVRHMNDTWDKNIIDNTFENIKIIKRRRVDNNKRYRDTRHTVNLLLFTTPTGLCVYRNSMMKHL